jgi:N-sulfoglucosamine sulfohydrolase
MKTSHVVTVLAIALMAGTAATAAGPNVLFFTADDMNFDSSGVFGGPIKDLTPNIDRLASQGMRFAHAYSTVAVCQPVRQTMLCGLYPHRSGSMGFFPVHGDVRTLNQELRKAGYLISCYGKTKHLQPRAQFCADVEDDSISRHPTKLAAATRDFIRLAKERQKPFFHNVNCYDPHRPFIGMQGPDDLAKGEEPSRRITVGEVTRVPGFLEDLPDIRRELAGYYTNVRRLDDALGAVLAVLEEEGVADETIVVFYGGDHGMSFPFGKSNSYANSSRGALIVRWPGVTKPGNVDSAHMVTTLDFTPTMLDMLGLPALASLDGRSFALALRGETMVGWDRVFTVYNAAFGNNWLPMRCIRTRSHSYLWNAWSDGTKKYQTENMAGLTWKAMLAAAESDPAIKARTDFYSFRVPEEFYDLQADPCERVNLIDASDHGPEIDTLRCELLAMMQATGDPFAEAFAHRDRREVATAVLEHLRKQHAAPVSAGPGSRE